MDNVTAAILAGGRGERLRPLTDTTPKPMLPVGGAPILDRLVSGLRASGVGRVEILTGYMHDIIAANYRECRGHAFGPGVIESFESGTAAPLRSLPEYPDDHDLIVCNGDILANVDWRAMVEQHRARGSAITVGVRWHRSRLPFGVVECDGRRVVGLSEKPCASHLINAGFYVITRGVLRDIRESSGHLDMTEVVQNWAHQTEQVEPFGHHGEWIDIGTPEQYAAACERYGDSALTKEISNAI